MPEAWQSAFVEVVPDFKNFRGEANRQMSGILGDAGDDAGRAGSGRFGNSFIGGVGKLAVPIAGAIAALGIGNAIGDAVSAGISFALDGVKLAGSLEQSRGAVEAVFGEQSTLIKNYAKASGTNLGLAENDFNQLATVIGSQLKNGGYAIDEIAAKSNDLITIGADLSALFGGTTAEAVDALSSALRGERDPIERYGVSLNQAAIDAKAAELGFTKVGGSLSTQAQQAATLALIYDKTRDAQGRFAAEGDTFQGQQQRLAAAFQDTQAQLGIYLLPALTELVSLANEKLIPAFGDLVNQVGPQLADAITEVTPSLLELFDAIAPMLPELIRLGTELLPLVIGAFIALAPFLIDSTKNFTGLLGSVNAFADFISGDTTLVQLAEQLVGLTGGIGDAARAGEGFGTRIRETLQGILRFIGGIDLFQSGRDFIQGFINGAQTLAGRLFDQVTAPFRNVVGGVKKLLGIASPSKVMAEIGQFTYEGFALGIGRGSERYAVDDFFVPNVAGIKAGSRTSYTLNDSTPAGTNPGQGFVNYGTIQVTDERALVAEVEKRKRRANVAYGIGEVVVA